MDLSIPLIDKPLPYIISSVLIPIIISVNVKLYKNIKNEEHLEKGKVIQYIIKTYSIVQCVSYPLIILCSWMIYFFGSCLKILPPVIVRIIVPPLRYMFVFTSDYYSFHSLIIAISRYTFLIFSKESETFGIKRLRSLLITSSIVVPICTTFIYALTSPIHLPMNYHLNSTVFSPTMKNATRFFTEDTISYSEYQNISPLNTMANTYFPSTVNCLQSVVSSSS